jgi:hypothetical protein
MSLSRNEPTPATMPFIYLVIGGVSAFVFAGCVLAVLRSF